MAESSSSFWLDGSRPRARELCYLRGRAARRGCGAGGVGRWQTHLDAEALAERLASDGSSRNHGGAVQRRPHGARAARARVAFFVRQMDACANPWGFADSDLPMHRSTRSRAADAANFAVESFLNKARRPRAAGRAAEPGSTAGSPGGTLL